VVAAHTVPQIAARIAASRSRPGGRRFLGVRLPGGFDPSRLLDDPRTNNVIASFERPNRRFALVAVGEAGRVQLPAGAGPEAARAEALRLLNAPAAVDTPELRPRLLGGFAFDERRAPSGPWAGFGSGSLLLPRLLFVRDDDVTGVVVAPGVDPGEVEALLGRATSGGRADAPASLRVCHDLDRERLRSGIRDVASQVRAGRYEKVVLAGTRELEAEAPFNLGVTLARLRTGYPYCHLFSVTAGDATFLGASPELLVSLQAGVVSSLGLAGSTRRGADPVEDEALGRALLGSAKDRIEHEIVVRALREGLAPLTEQLRAPNHPTLLRLRNIQHLATDISACALPGIDVFSLVQRLHPSPAVCGWPTAAARDVIEQHEAFDRGWYAAPVGWVDAAGDGEFAVALRSALVRGSRAWLFAGAGIMGDSDPDEELAEIELKLRPLAGALASGAG
jgi:salicylate biosynthesis isochorismate synthase/menaquinone-specific isochorismate synthase